MGMIGAWNLTEGGGIPFIGHIKFHPNQSDCVGGVLGPKTGRQIARLNHIIINLHSNSSGNNNNNNNNSNNNNNNNNNNSNYNNSNNNYNNNYSNNNNNNNNYIIIIIIIIMRIVNVFLREIF